jgi:exosortase
VTTKLTHSQLGAFVFWFASLVVAWRPLAATFTLALRDDEYTHILLILPISVTLIYLNRQYLGTLISRNIPVGSGLCLSAVVIALFAHGWPVSFTPDVDVSIAMFALVMWWIGTFVFWFGSRAARSALFPFCFLLGLVPLPRFALDEIIALLQSGSAWTAHALFAMTGVPVMQTGVFLTIPGLTVQVAQECSSIRSSSMLLVTTIVLAQLLLRSPWRKALIIALAVPLSIAKNGLRIWTIAILGTRVDPGYLNGRLHHQGGILFFAVALLSVFVFLWLLRRGEDFATHPA